MQRIRYIILNGPPGSGKTEMARELCSILGDVANQTRGFSVKAVTDSFSMPLKQFVSTALGEQHQYMDKVRARAEFNGYSIREFMIDMAEKYIKGKYGDDVFGRWLVHRSLRNPLSLPRYYIVDDGGFIPEMDAVPNKFVVKVTREKRDFTSDSRGYYPNHNTVWENKGPLAGLWMAATHLADEVKRFKWKG